eukprot:TRINITY_DN2249_c0_g1_i9.p1 TRINITY_DN2249_c0_g1~~TRINITY_DN2249_c0_g1_i9.p1  ORF type:complete len:659 (-),score=125.38 TRINITY_DN2249_c0_g1_i9:90-2066(-)
MQKYPTDSITGEYGLKVLNNLGLKLDCVSALLACATDIIVTVMRQHVANCTIQVEACRVLSLISSCDITRILNTETSDCIMCAIETHPMDCRIKYATWVMIEACLILPKLEEPAITFLSKLLKLNATPPSLDLSCKQIGEGGVKHLLSSLNANTSLTALDISYPTNSTTSTVSCGATIGAALKENSSLTSLNLESYVLDEAGAFLGEALKVNTTLLALNMSACHFTVSGLRLITKGLSVNSTLLTLNLAKIKFSSEELEVLTCFLASVNSLTELNLPHCYIGSNGYALISNALKVNGLLASLCLDSNSVDTECGKRLAEALQVNTSLVTLSLKNIFLSSEGVQCLFRALKINNTLSSINLALSKVDDAAVVVLANVLPVNLSLKVLGLRGASFNLVSFKLLTSAIAQQSSIVSLDLSENRAILVEDGLPHLCQFLTEYHPLTTLKLNDNQQNADDLQRLADGLKDNRNFKLLSIRSIPYLGKEEGRILSEILKSSKSLTYLNLGEITVYEPEPVQYLTSGLEASASLVKFSIKRTRTEQLATIFFEHLSSSQSLKYLNMSGNLVSGLEGETISKLIHSNTTVTFVDLSFCSLSKETRQCVLKALCLRCDTQHQPLAAFLLGHFIFDDQHNQLLKSVPVNVLKHITQFYKSLTHLQISF